MNSSLPLFPKNTIRITVSQVMLGVFLFFSSILLLHPSQAQTVGDYKSRASGDWSNFTTWSVFDGAVWQNAVAGQVPGGTSEADANNVYLEAGFTVTLSQDAACKDLHLNGVQDVVRINTGDFALNIWGKMRSYTGTAPGNTDNGATGAGIAGFINTGTSGRLKFRGTVDRTIFVLNELTANSRIAGWRLDFAFDPGVTGYCKNTIRCGHLEVSSGILDVSGVLDGEVADYEIRVAGDDYVAQPGNGVSGGTVIIRNGATLKSYRLHKNNPTTVGNSLASFTVESGGVFVSKLSNTVATLAYDISGEVRFESASAQSFLSAGGKVDAVSIVNYHHVTLAGGAAKTLVNNVTITGTLTLEGTASLGLGAFTLAYGTDATLEYKGSGVQTTTNAEFPVTNGPFNLNINNSNGVSLHSSRTLNGLLTLTSGNFNIQNNHFTLGENSPAIAGTPSSTNMLVTSGTGELRKVFSAPGFFYFPLGETTGTTEYAYARIDVNSATVLDATTYVGLRVIDAAHPAVAATSPVDYLSRYWSVSSNMSNVNFNGTFQYWAADVNGDETSINVYAYDDETALASGVPIVRVSALQRIVVSGMTSLGFVTGANMCAISNNDIAFSGALEYCGTSSLSSSFTGSVATVASSSPSYQWQQQINNGTWADVSSGGTSQDYAEGAALSVNSYKYRRVVSDLLSCLATDVNLSNEIEITVYDGITGNQVGANQALNSGGTPDPFTETATLSGGNGTYTYQWQVASVQGGPYSDIDFADAATFTADAGPTTDLFYVRNVESGVCSSTSNEVGITIVTSVSYASYASLITVYPNPTSELLTIDLSNVLVQGVPGIVLIDNQGMKLMEQEYTLSDHIALDMQHYASGLYLVHLSIDGVFVATYKVSKK